MGKPGEIIASVTFVAVQVRLKLEENCVVFFSLFNERESCVKGAVWCIGVYSPADKHTCTRSFLLPNNKSQSKSSPTESGKLPAHCANCHEEIQSAQSDPDGPDPGRLDLLDAAR